MGDSNNFQVECGTGAWTRLDLSQMWCALWGNWKTPPTHFHTGAWVFLPEQLFCEKQENCSQLMKLCIKGKSFSFLKGRGGSEFSLPWKVLNISVWWQGPAASLGNHCVWRRRETWHSVVEALTNHMRRASGSSRVSIFMGSDEDLVLKQRPEAAAPILETHIIIFFESFWQECDLSGWVGWGSFNSPRQIRGQDNLVLQQIVILGSFSIFHIPFQLGKLRMSYRNTVQPCATPIIRLAFSSSTRSPH